jgi:hypothetical protein
MSPLFLYNPIILVGFKPCQLSGNEEKIKKPRTSLTLNCTCDNIFAFLTDRIIYATMIIVYKLFMLTAIILQAVRYVPVVIEGGYV